MQSLIAHPDERIRASGKVRDNGELKKPIIRAARSRANLRILIFLSIFVFGVSAVLVSLEGGEKVWRDKIEKGSVRFIAALSNELGLVVKTITILGNNAVAPEVFMDNLSIRVGEPMVLTDLGGALARLSNLEWVRTVEVSRHWPSELVVDVRERTPVALWESVDGRVLIDKDGYSFGSSYIDDFPNLPLINGVGAPEKFPRLSRILDKNSLVKQSVEGAVLVGARRWNLQMKGNLLVRLPEAGLELAWVKFTTHFKEGYFSSVGAVVADYTLADRLILVLDTESGDKDFDNLARRQALETITKAQAGQISDSLGLVTPG